MVVEDSLSMPLTFHGAFNEQSIEGSSEEHTKTLMIFGELVNVERRTNLHWAASLTLECLSQGHSGRR